MRADASAAMMVACALATPAVARSARAFAVSTRGGGDEALCQQILVALELRERVGLLGLRLRQRSLRRAHVGLRALRLRDDVARVDARNDVAGLDDRAFRHAEPFEPAGSFRRNRRLALRDDVTGGVEQDELLRRVRGHDRRRLDRHDPRLARVPDARGGDNQRERAPPQPAPAAARPDRRQVAVDLELGEVGRRIRRHGGRIKRTRGGGPASASFILPWARGHLIAPQPKNSIPQANTTTPTAAIMRAKPPMRRNVLAAVASCCHASQTLHTLPAVSTAARAYGTHPSRCPPLWRAWR